MKQFFTFLIALCAFYISRAQRVDLDRYNFTASYRELPRFGLDTSSRTFSLQTSMTQGSSYILRQERPEDRVNIIGWKKMNRNAHLLVNVNLEDIIVDHSEVKERIEILKDKAGKQVGANAYYYTEVLYTFAGKVRVAEYNGRELLNYAISDRNAQKTYRTKEFASYNEALNSFIQNVFSVTSSITSLEVNRAMTELDQSLNNSFGYPMRTAGDYLWILDSKRHPEYRAHRQAWTSFKQAMFQMRADQPLDEVAEMLKPVIGYFKKMIVLYNSDSKGDRKMRYASYYDLSKIYYYLDQPDEALYNAGQLMINDYDERDGRGLEAAANDLKKVLEMNRVQTRHFPLDTDEYQGRGIVGNGFGY